MKTALAFFSIILVSSAAHASFSDRCRQATASRDSVGSISEAGTAQINACENIDTELKLACVLSLKSRDSVGGTSAPGAAQINACANIDTEWELACVQSLKTRDSVGGRHAPSAARINDCSKN